MRRFIRASGIDKDELSYPLAAVLKGLCDDSGYYQLRSCYQMNNRLYISIVNDRNTFAPELSFEDNRRREGQRIRINIPNYTGFKLQTTAYGYLQPDEYEEMLSAQQLALDLVRAMEQAIERIGVDPETVLTETEEY